MRLLLVEDDAALAAALAARFEERGDTIDHAPHLAEARLRLATSQYAAIILDRGLPDGDGIELLRGLRQQGSDLPVIVLSARSEIGARISGLDAGADDYLTKPFSPDELAARLRAVMRRKGQYQGRAIACANLAFDTDNQALEVGGQPVALSAREASMLELLLRRQGQVVTRRLAEDQLFAGQEILGSNAIEVCVHRLRAKLEAAGAEAEIVTVRGVGYLLKGGE